MSRIQFDSSSFSRRDLILVVISIIIIIGVVVGLIIFLVGNSSGRQNAGVKLTLTPTASPVFAVSELPSSSPSGPPTETPTLAPTPTIEPYQYTIQTNDTMIAIIQLFGYRDLSVIPEIVRLNNLPNENILPPPGSVLLIPRQTPTPGPSATPTIEGTPPGPTQDYKGCSPNNRCVSPDGQFWVHEVTSGDTPLGIAFAYNSRVDAIMQANGLPANSPIYPGQKLNIPILVTLTPTLTPTGGLDSTATPTPTLNPPSLLAPADNASVASGQPVILQWIADHPLQPSESYLIILTNVASGQETRFVTRTNTFRLPSSLQPGLGGGIQYQWQVLVINGSSTSSPVISGQDVKWTFKWGS